MLREDQKIVTGYLDLCKEIKGTGNNMWENLKISLTDRCLKQKQ